MNQLKNGLMEVVSDNQSAFVPERSIFYNIMLTQELVKNYHLQRGIPRCAFKIDIQQAYDTVDWSFLRSILVHFGFHRTMINWIMACVTSTSFSISNNGDMHGYFKGKRGLRQGVPMSPYLFTLVMEVLSLMLKRGVVEARNFKFHLKCSKLKLINLCFADDLIMFSHGNKESVLVFMKALNEFRRASVLVPSIPKSTTFFSNVWELVKKSILVILPFE